MPRTSYSLFACFCLLVFLAASAQAATTNSWTGGNGNWSDAANWTNSSNQHVVPITGDNVQIVNNDGVSRTISYDSSAPAATLSGLTVDLTGGSGSATNMLTNSASLFVVGDEVIGNLGSGAYSQSGTNTVSGSISIGAQAGSTGSYSFNGYTSATTVYVGGSSAGAGGTGTLSIGGTLSVGTLTAYNTLGSGINLNGGRINASALNFNGTPFNWNSGTLTINSDVAWSGGAPANSTSSALGSEVSLTSSSKSLIVNGNETIGGAGPFTLTLNSNSANSHSVTGTVTVAPNGTLILPSSSTNTISVNTPSLIQAGGTIYGTLYNTGNFVYQSGTFNGRLVNQGTASLGSNLSIDNIENDTNMTISGTVTCNSGFPAGLDNFGNLTLAGGTIVTSSSSSQLINEVSGSITGHGNIRGYVTNNGRFTLDGVVNFNTSGSNTFTNNGILQGNGTLNLGTSSSTFANGNGGTINVAAGNALSINISSSSGWNNPGLINMQGSGALLGGTQQTGSTNPPPAQINNTGTIQGAGTIAARINNNGVLRASGGELDLSASNFSTNTNSSIQVTAGSTIMFLQGLSNNSGTISLTGGTFDNNNHTMTSGTSSATINGYGTIRTAGLTNSGKINVGEGNMDIFGSVTNQGTIGIQGGRSVYFYGNVSGNGSFTGPGTATFLAALSPGNSPASVSFGGNVDLTSASALSIELGGTTVGSQYDRLDVAGQLSLGGALNVSLINSFKPAAGNTFDILNWNSLSGTFTGGINLPSLTGAVAWDTSSLYTTGALSVIATYYKGDFNRDGHVNAADIFPMESAIADLDGYQSAKGLTPTQLLSIGDVNGDGAINSTDVQKLLTNIQNGGGSADPVPEPSTFVLSAGSLLLALSALHRRKRQNRS